MVKKKSKILKKARKKVSVEDETSDEIKYSAGSDGWKTK